MSFYKNKRLIYLMVFFHNLIPAYVIERLFWQERGMTIQMVVYCEFIYAATVIILEIPSGVLADLIGRKKLIVISSIMPCLEFLLLIYSTKFWHFAAIVFLAGIGTALSSGAYNALLYDSLVSCDRTSEFEKIIGKINAFDFTAAMIAAVTGGYLAFRFDFVFNYWISIISCAIALLLSFLLAEPPRVDDGEGRATWRTVIKSAVTFFKHHTNVLRIVIHSSIIAACIIYIDEFWQLYLEYFSFPVVLFGVASVGLFLSRIPSSIVSAYLLRYFKHSTVLTFASFLCGLGILFAALIPGVAGLCGIIAAISMGALIEPIAMGYLHHNADDNARATIESILSLFERFFSIVIGLIFGYIATKHLIIAGYWILGTLIIVVSIMFSLIYKKKDI